MSNHDEQPRRAITRPELAADLHSLGVRDGGVVMVHTRMSAIGWVVGGSETVVRALLDALGPQGTLMAYASWEDHVYATADWPTEHREAYLAHPPVFDVKTGAVDPDYGRIPERIRTWPGARRSAHPEAGVVAVGRQAEWLTATHPDDDAYGPHSPFARLVEARGQVLMLGAPLDTVTLLHHAEAIADVAGKRRLTFTIPVAEQGAVVEHAYTDIDTSRGAFDYDRLDLDEDAFALIARAALADGIGVRGHVGQAASHLFEARELTAFAVRWMEERFGDLGHARARADLTDARSAPSG
jgi:aminoglycoside 3-N-acetyltransferase